MAIKFKITGERISEVCNVAEYLLLNSGHRDTIIRIAPRFVTKEDGNYIVTAVLDNDGDIEKFENLAEAFALMATVTPKRLEKLAGEFTEAVKNIVNPQSAGA